MEKTSTLVNDIYSGTTDYIRLQTRSLKLEVYERITNVIASGISASFILLFGLFSFLFINFGLAFWLSEVLESNKLGFFAVGGFYVIVLGIYLVLKDKIAKNKVKNAVLLKVSKSHNDYDLLLKEQAVIHVQVDEKEKQIKENFEELKENLETLKEDFNRLKSHFVSEDNENGEHVGPKIPRIAITSLIDLIMNKVVLRKAGLVKKFIFPLLANALVTSAVFKENKKTSLVENLRLKFSKFLA
jgi:uncharacterized membrane protein